MLAPQKPGSAQPIGTTVREEALVLDGYQLVLTSGVHCGDPNHNHVWTCEHDWQEFTIQQSKTGKWTFTGWCSDEACTTPITEVTNITADMDVYGKWTYETIELAENEITFYYEKVPEVTTYTVRYINIETGEQLCPDEVRKGVVPGTTVTEYAKEIDGYTPL